MTNCFMGLQISSNGSVLAGFIHSIMIMKIIDSVILKFNKGSQKS